MLLSMRTWEVLASYWGESKLPSEVWGLSLLFMVLLSALMGLTLWLFWLSTQPKRPPVRAEQEVKSR